MHKLLSTAALAAACTFAGGANAEIITYQFSATVIGGAVTYADGSDDFGMALMGDARVLYGDSLTGRLSYDTDMPKWLTPRPDLQLYLGGNAGLSYRIAESGFTFASSGADLPQASVGINGSRYRGVTDHFSLTSHSYSEDDTVPPYVTSLLFVDRDGTAFDTTALPAVLDLRWFEQVTLSTLHFGPAYNSQFYAQVTSLERVSAVPEPASSAMLLAGLGLLAGARLRRQRR